MRQVRSATSLVLALGLCLLLAVPVDGPINTVGVGSLPCLQFMAL